MYENSFKELNKTKIKHEGFTLVSCNQYNDYKMQLLEMRAFLEAIVT